MNIINLQRQSFKVIAELVAVCKNNGQDTCAVQACLEVQKAVLFTGTTGVGKSVIVSGALERLRGTKTVVPYTVNFSAQTQAMDTQVGSQPFLFSCHMHA